MMSVKNILLVLIVLTLASCQSVDYKGPPKQEIVENKIIAQTAKQLEKEKKLVPAGFGGSAIEGKEYLSISFNYFEPLNIEKARELVVYAAQVFLENLNSSEKLKKLIKKPYTMNNIQIIIFCYMSDYSTPIPPKLGLVDIRRNTIFYKYDTGNFEEAHKETYKEALEILKVNKSEQSNAYDED